MAQRKLIRPSMQEIKEKYPVKTAVRRKQTPPDQTNAESFYYLKQMAARTPMVIVLKDGQELRGWLEWYDKTCVKLNRESGPNLLLFKDAIKYMFKEEELSGRKERD